MAAGGLRGRRGRGDFCVGAEVVATAAHEGGGIRNHRLDGFL